MLFGKYCIDFLYITYQLYKAFTGSLTLHAQKSYEENPTCLMTGISFASFDIN